MAINLPRYSKDSPVDLVDGAYGLAMGQIEKELSNVSTAVTKSEQAFSTAEQAKTSVLQQQGEIDKIRGDLDGLIAGGGEASVPIATTEKAGIVKPDGTTISVKQDGGITLADHSVNTDKLTAAAVNTMNIGNGQVSTEKLADYSVNSMKLATGVVTEDKLSDDIKEKLNKPSGSEYTLPLATNETLGGIKLGSQFKTHDDALVIEINAISTGNISNSSVTEEKLSTEVQAKLNKEGGSTGVPDNSVTSAKIADGAVVRAKIGVAAVGETQLGANSVTSTKIADKNVTEAKLADAVVTKLNKSGLESVPDPLTIGSLTVSTSLTMPANAVKTANITDHSVTKSKIQDGCVSEDKLAENVVEKLNKTGGGVTLDAVYPVGSVYISFNATSPETLFGFGKWSKIEGRFLFASDSNHASGTTGGSNDAVVVSHSHTGTADSGGSHTHTTSTESHTHSATTASAGKHTHETGQSGYNFVITNGEFGYGSGSSRAPAPSSETAAVATTGAHTHTVNVTSNSHSHDVNSGGAHSHTLSINFAGSSGTGKNMPAYMAVNMWQRVS